MSNCLTSSLESPVVYTGCWSSSGSRAAWQDHVVDGLFMGFSNDAPDSSAILSSAIRCHLTIPRSFGGSPELSRCSLIRR